VPQNCPEHHVFNKCLGLRVSAGPPCTTSFLAVGRSVCIDIKACQYVSIASREAEAEKGCLHHPGEHSCALRPPSSVDIWLACPPCQPYSGMRSAGGAAEDHEGFKVCFGETGSVISHLKLLLPSVFVAEQVEGFAKPRKNLHGISPKEAFCTQVLGIQRPDGARHFVGYMVLDMNSSYFLEGSRPRFLGRSFRFLVRSVAGNHWHTLLIHAGRASSGSLIPGRD
jgi:site-specific DNA-cytosine methylase